MLSCVHLQVSTTRLAVRNIPVSWDEKRLKAVFIAGVKERATKENPKVVQVCPTMFVPLLGCAFHTTAVPFCCSLG